MKGERAIKYLVIALAVLVSLAAICILGAGCMSVACDQIRAEQEFDHSEAMRDVLQIGPLP
jgi:hypothetical protein